MRPDFASSPHIPLPPEGWLKLTPAKKPGAHIFLRKAAIHTIECDEDARRPHSIIRVYGSEYYHLVEESPDAILEMLAERR